MSKRVILLGLPLLLILLASCTPAATARPPTEDQPIGVVIVTPEESPYPVIAPSAGNGLEEVVEQLQDAGAAVIVAGPVDQPFFSGKGRVLEINGEEVQIFEYPSEEARLADSEQISADGYQIGTTMVSWVAPPRFWATDRYILLYLGENSEVIELLNAIAGRPIAGVTPDAPVIAPAAYPPAVVAAINDLSKRTGIPAEEIVLVTAEDMQWNDSCLGLAAPDEMCLQVITPGFLIILEAGGIQYEYHTNMDGSVLRYR